MGEGASNPDIPKPSVIASANATTERARSRIPEQGLTQMNINGYIASLTDMANSPMNMPEQNDSLIKAVGLYSYLRDNQQATTVGDARSSLEQRKIDPKVVKLWVEEEMAVNPGEYAAIAKGYPEYTEDLQRVRNVAIDRVLGKGK